MIQNMVLRLQVLPACCPVAMTFCELSAEFTVDGAVDSFGKELVTVASNYVSSQFISFLLAI